jgi:hypothetical protein
MTSLCLEVYSLSWGNFQAPYLPSSNWGFETEIVMYNTKYGIECKHNSNTQKCNHESVHNMKNMFSADEEAKN